MLGKARGRGLSAALIAVSAILGLIAAAAIAAGPGKSDTRYGSKGIAKLGGDTRVLGAATQPDGKLVVVGESGTKAGSVHLLVARLTASGKPDRSFHGGKPYLGPVGTSANAVAIQSDGKVVVAGNYTQPVGQSPLGMLVLRLNPGGSPDRSFSGDGFAKALDSEAGQALAVALQKDGRIVAAGDATGGQSSDGLARTAVARFRSNGALDTSFGQGGAAVIDLGRLSFARGVAIQPNGRIVIAGSQRNDLQTTQVLAARLTSAGALDSSFNGTGAYLHQYAQGAGFSAAYAVTLVGGGKILLGGTALTAAAGGNALAVRLTSSGQPDASFGSGGATLVPASRNRSQFTQTPNPGARAMSVAANGDIILAGHFDDFGLREAAVWGLRAGGALDSRFGQGGSTVLTLPENSQFDALALAPDGSLLAAGQDLPDIFGAPVGLIAAFGGFPVKVQVGAAVKRSYRLGPALRKGIRVAVTCSRACNLKAQLKAYGKVVARASGKLKGTGRRVLKLRFTKAGKARLAGRARVNAKLTIVASGGGKDTLTRKVVLKG